MPLTESTDHPQNSSFPKASSSLTALPVDLMLWRRPLVSFGFIVSATVVWVLLERTGLPFISISSDILLLLVTFMFARANYAEFRNKELETLPELELSEEMVNSMAASLCLKFNHMLLIAHNITISQDFPLFLKAMVCLWALSEMASIFSFITLLYIATVTWMILPALYVKYGAKFDVVFCGKFESLCKAVDKVT